MVTSAGANKLAGGGPGPPGAEGGAPSAPLESVSFPPSSLHQPFAVSSHHRVDWGSSWEAGAGWEWGTQRRTLELVVRMSGCALAAPGKHAHRLLL